MSVRSVGGGKPVLVHRYPNGIWSAAFAPDGTLYALTHRSGELYAHPPDGSAKVLVAQRILERDLEGHLTVSPDGNWVSVSFRSGCLFRTGPFAERLTKPDGVLRLGGWRAWDFSHLGFDHPLVFTGDSAYLVGQVRGFLSRDRHRLWTYRLSELSEITHDGFDKPYRNELAVVPGTARVVMHGWSAEHQAVELWRSDLSQPLVPAVLLGTIKHSYFNGLKIGADGRYYVSVPKALLIYSLDQGVFHLERTVALPQFSPIPHIALSADATRFVSWGFRQKIVYAGDTRTGEVFGPWDWKIGDVNDVAIAPDGLTAAAAGSNKKVAVWDLE